jgi:hypothetical protein
VNPNNPFGSTPLKSWYHVNCFFELKKAKNSKTMTCSGDIEGWELLSDEDQQMIIKKIGPEFTKTSSAPAEKKVAGSSLSDCQDNKFSEFQKIVGKIAKEPSYNSKSNILQKFLLDVINSLTFVTINSLITIFC